MKPALKYGLINGGIAILWSLLMYITGLNRNANAQWINILQLAIPIALMTMAVKEYRLTTGNGWITFGKAFNQSFQVGLIGGVIGTAFYFIYISVIDPAFIDYQKTMQIDKMAENGMSEEMIEKGMQQAAFFMTPGMQVVFGLIFVLIVSSLLGLLVAAIFKKPNLEEIS